MIWEDCQLTDSLRFTATYPLLVGILNGLRALQPHPQDFLSEFRVKFVEQMSISTITKGA